MKFGAYETLAVAGSGICFMGASLVLGLVTPDNERWLLTVWFFLGLLAAGFPLASARVPQVTLALKWISAYPARWLQISGGQVWLLVCAPQYAYMAHLAAGFGKWSPRGGVAVALWALALACVIAGAYRRPKAHAPVLDRRDWYWVLVLFLLAFALRGTALDQLPATFAGDEGSAGLEAVRFWQGKANNPFTVGWFEFPTFYFAVQSLGIGFYGQTMEGARISSAVAGALVVPAVYWFARAAFDRKTAVGAAALLAAAHYHIHFSRIGLNNIWDTLLVVLALAALWRGWQTGDRLWFIVCGLVVGLGQYFYATMRIVPVIVAIWFGFAVWSARRRALWLFPDLVLTAYVSLVTFLPLAALFLKSPPAFLSPHVRVSIFKEGWIAATAAAAGQSALDVLIEHVRVSALGLVSVPLGNIWYKPGTPLLLFPAAVLFVGGLLVLLARLDLRYLLVFLPIFANVILMSFTIDVPAAQRYMLAMPFIPIVMAFFPAEMLVVVKKYWPRYRRYAYGLVGFIIVGLMLIDARFYFLEVYERFTFGGFNTEAATRVGQYLSGRAGDVRTVYFVDTPERRYSRFTLILFLAPDMAFKEVDDTMTGASNLAVDGDSLFVVLPERAQDFEQMLALLPGGQVQPFYNDQEELLFLVYEPFP